MALPAFPLRDLADVQTNFDDLDGRVEGLGRRGAWHQIGAAGEPAFQNSWANYDTRVCRFYKDAGQRVHLVGFLQSGSTGTVCFTLPAGYRPVTGGTSGWLYAVVTNGGTGSIEVRSDGTVRVQSWGSTWVGLNGISFLAEA